MRELTGKVRARQGGERQKRLKCSVVRLLALAFLTALILFAFGDTAWAGYTTTQLTSNSSDDYDASINNCGQVVWQGYDNEIFFFSGGVTTQLTNLYVESAPQINDTGQVVWQGSGGNGGWKIFLYSGGVTTQLVSNNYYDRDPRINGSG